MKVRVATVLIVALFATPLAPLLAQAPAPTGDHGQAPPTTAKPATAKPAAAAAAAAADWRMAAVGLTASGAALVIYQPQVSSWSEPETRIEAFAAVSYTAKGAKPALGTLKLESSTSVAADQRLVSFSEFKIAESNFPTVPREQVKTIVSEITAAVRSGSA